MSGTTSYVAPKLTQEPLAKILKDEKQVNQTHRINNIDI